MSGAVVTTDPRASTASVLRSPILLSDRSTRVRHALGSKLCRAASAACHRADVLRSRLDAGPARSPGNLVVRNIRGRYDPQTLGVKTISRHPWYWSPVWNPMRAPVAMRASTDVMPAAQRVYWYARRGGVAAREINRIPAVCRPTDESRLWAAGIRQRDRDGSTCPLRVGLRATIRS
jgi:hypothetical protein